MNKLTYRQFKILDRKTSACTMRDVWRGECEFWREVLKSPQDSFERDRAKRHHAYWIECAREVPPYPLP